MCGIIGYAGTAQAAPILLEGLSKLEYRGYDSAGICVHNQKGMQVVKSKGRLAALAKKCRDGQTVPGVVGIGHTRWATHGAPSDVNSHPHLSQSGKIAVVHNGIVENEAYLRRWLEKKGLTFLSQTDTEVIANLVGWYYEQSGNFEDSVRKAEAQLTGSYALAIMCSDQPNTIIGLKKDSPLIFGWGEGGCYIASDIPAILSHTQTISYLEDDEMVAFSAEKVLFYDRLGNMVKKKRERISWQSTSTDREGYDYFMLKEIFEQPKAVWDTISPRIQKDTVVLNDVVLTGDYMKSLRRICLVACGSAYYAAVAAKYIFERMCRFPTEAIMASEFRYCEPLVDGDSLVIFISQSGETADTLAALREAKRRGAHTLAVVNVPGSAIAKEAEQVLCTWAGPEIAVATTKAFSAQLAVIDLLAVYLAKQRDAITGWQEADLLQSLRELPEVMEQMLGQEKLEKCRRLAARYRAHRDAYYIGRNVDSAICMEGSLKLKEVAYLHSEAYPAGELKHGPISMIEGGTLVVALATVDALFDKTMANVREVKARGAEVLCVTLENREREAAMVADHVITVPAVHPVLQPNLSLLPLQLFAYYMAVERGCDVDKPRNLAKSVTVE